MSSGSYVHFNTNTTAQLISASAQALNRVIVNQAGKRSLITLYEGTSNAGTVIASIDTTKVGTFEFNLGVYNLFVETTGDSAADLTVVYGGSF